MEVRNKMNLFSRLSAARALAPALVLALAASEGLFAQESGGTTVFPPGAKPVSISLNAAEWSARWWDWNYSIRNQNNPTLDMTGAKCQEGQSGPMFFLAGAPVTTPVTRTCTIPAGKTLFFPLVTAECSNVEPPPFFGANKAQLISCAKAVMDLTDPSSLRLTVDGVPVGGNLSGMRARSPLFAFTLTANNQLGLRPGTSALSISDGFWIMLRLSPGNHVVHFEAALPDAGFSQDITYNLTVLGN
jgi:hypothetical protein